MQTTIEYPTNITMNRTTFQKMMFISNALEQGWCVKKTNDTFIFSKKHENRREIFQEEYLERFILENMKTTPENI
jgi:hypothetical protein